MGLDIVELFMEVEDVFDIQIPDDRYVEVSTVGGLYDFIIEAKGEAVSLRNRCLSMVTFLMIRRALVAETKAARQSIRPRTSVDEALPTYPAYDRRALWDRLQETLGLQLPQLCRPAWLVTMSTAVTIFIALVIGALVDSQWGSNAAALIGMLSLVVIGVVASFVTQPFAMHPHASFTTFRGLSGVVLAHNHSALCNKLQGDKLNAWNPNDVWEALRALIVEQLDVKPELVRKEALFYEDLGAG